MKICKHLFNDINFEPAAIQPCCNTHGIEVPAFPFSGGEFPAQEYGQHLVKTLRKLQTSETLCKNCPDLLSFDDNQKYSADVLFNKR